MSTLRLPLPLIVLALLPFGQCFIACSEQSNPNPGFAAGSTAAGISSPQAPQGPYPRGQATALTLPDPATVGPVVSVIAPLRGEQLAASQVVVRLRASDPDGVVRVEVAGAAARPAGAEVYEATVPLHAGLNVIAVEAEDGRGNVSIGYTSLLQGSFAPDDRVYSGSAAVSLTETGLDRLDAVLGPELAKLDLYGILAAKNPIYDTAILDVNLRGLRYQALRTETQGAANGLQITFEFDELEAPADVDVIGFGVAAATLGARVARATVHATIDRSAVTGPTPIARALGLRIDAITVDLTDFRMTATSGAAALLAPFRSILTGVLENLLETLLLAEIDDLFAKSIPGIDVPVAVPLTLGAGTGQLGLQLELDDASGAPGAGVDIAGGGRVTHLGPLRPAAPRTVLDQGTSAPRVRAAAPDAFALSVSADLVNALLHSAFVQDALSLTIDGTQLPASGGNPISVAFLYPFLPPVRELAPDPATPVVIEVGVASPPLLSFPGQGAAANIDVGEVEVSLAIDYMDGGPRLQLFTLRCALQIEAEVALDAASVRLTRLKAKQIVAEVSHEPTVDIADGEIERFFAAALPYLVDQFAVGTVPPLPVPALPLGLRLTSPAVESVPGAVILRGSL